MSENKKVLLTGISGYIGNHCAVELLKNGYSVRGSVRSLSKSKQLTQVIKKEIVDIADMADKLSGLIIS